MQPFFPQVADVQEEMRAKSCDWQMVVYGRAYHSFMMPDADAVERGIKYDRWADKSSWEMMRQFLAEGFGSC